jgi:hypothetical protein
MTLKPPQRVAMSWLENFTRLDDMARKKKSNDQIPAWFDLSKYMEAEKLDAYGWMMEIVERQVALDNNKFPDHLIKQPIHTNRDQQIIKYAEPDSFPIRDMTVGDMGYITEVLDIPVPQDEIKRFFTEHYRKVRSDRSNEYGIIRYIQMYFPGNRLSIIKEYERKHRDKIHKDPDRFLEIGKVPGMPVMVNLGLPDSDLKKCFEYWLAQKRKRFPEKAPHQKRKHDPVNYKKWVKLHVLPYIDLSIWAKNNGKTISYPAYAETLFPDAKRSVKNQEDNIRKTTQPTAERLLSGEYNELLISAAISERMRQEKYRKSDAGERKNRDGDGINKELVYSRVRTQFMMESILIKE